MYLTQTTDLGLDDGARAAPLGVAGPADGEEREEIDVAVRLYMRVCIGGMALVAFREAHAQRKRSPKRTTNRHTNSYRMPQAHTYIPITWSTRCRRGSGGSSPPCTR